MRSFTAFAAAAMSIAAPAEAQNWPAKPIRVVVPFGAGSATDIVPRIVMEQVSAQIGQPIVIENRAGAGSTTGTAIVAKADADGYTLLGTSSALTVSPSLYEKLPYDPVKDLTGIAILAGLPNAMIVNPQAPYQSLQEFVTFAKSGKKPLNFASVGVGSGTHFAAERFRLSAGYEAAHVPFKSGGEAITEVVAGRMDYYFCPIGTALPFIKEGKLRALAVDQMARVAALPDVPTTTESGFKDSDSAAWVGLLAPSGTPRAIVERLSREVAIALKEPKVADKLTPNGMLVVSVALQAFDAQIAQELKNNAAIAKSLGLKPQ